MDADGFDRLAKTVSGGTDRRRLLAGLGAVLAGLRGQPVAAAPAKPNGKPCTKNGQCRSEHCCRVAGQNSGTCRECCDDGDCGPGRLCHNQTCVPDAGTCTAGQNLCHDGTAPCGPGCQCVRTTSGATFCGLGSRCNDCARDEDCSEVTGPGSVCADYTGDFCSCRQTNRRACVAPCGACTSDRQCSEHQRCCDGECRDCCTTADCRGDETCEGGRCVCHGCRSHVNNTCRAGTAWDECGGPDSERCAACARGEICAAGRQTCAACESALIPRTVSWCEVIHDFATFQCAPNCSCATRHTGGIGVCFDRGVAGYCSSQEPICHRNQDCVDQGDGDYCVMAGDCKEGAHCHLTACVTACDMRARTRNARVGDGPPRMVVRD